MALSNISNPLGGGAGASSGIVAGGTLYGLNGQTITGNSSGAWAVTANSTGDVTLTAGSSGASLTLGQGASGEATVNRTLNITGNAAAGALLIAAPSGVANSLWRLQHFTGSFLSQDDPSLALGYNIGSGSRVNTSDSATWFGLEANYKVDISARGAGAQNYQEAYARFTGSGGNSLSGWTITSDKVNPFAFTLQTASIAGSGSYFAWNDTTTGSDVSMMTLFKTGPALQLQGYLGINVAPSTNYRLYLQESSAGTQNTLRISQTATSGASNAKLLLDTAAGGGDPFINFVSGAVEYSVGVDNSASGDPFKISASGALGTTDVLTLTSSGVEVGGNMVVGGVSIESTDTRSGAGAISITATTTRLTTTAADALTLADGTAGQIKRVVMVADGGDGTLTPTTKTGYTTITFNDVGDAVTLQFFTTLGWMIVSNYGCTVA